MGFDKQELIKGYLRAIEQNEEKIVSIRSRAIHGRDESERLNGIR